MSSKYKEKIDALSFRIGAVGFFDDLTEEECRELLEEVDRAALVVTGLECWTSTDEYFNCHVPEFFCQDYLFDFDGWHRHAFRQHLAAYAASVLRDEPDNPPLFCVAVSNLQEKKKFADEVNVIVRMNRVDPDFTSKPFERVEMVKVILIGDGAER